MSWKYDYGEFSENVPTVTYGPCLDDGEYFSYYRICPKCGRFVKADHSSKLPTNIGDETNATCKKCGRVQMLFAWWNEAEDVEDGL